MLSEEMAAKNHNSTFLVILEKSSSAADGWLLTLKVGHTILCSGLKLPNNFVELIYISNDYGG